MLNQPLIFSVRALALVALVAAPVAAEPQHPSITEAARKEAVRMAAADAKASVLPPNYPRTFAGPVPTSRADRQIVAGTAGAAGGLLAGAWIGMATSSVNCAGEDCGLRGLMVGAPIGAITGAVAGAMLTR